MFCVFCSFPQPLCEQDSQWNKFTVSCHVMSLDDVIQLMYHTSSIKPMAYQATVGSEKACNCGLTKFKSWLKVIQLDACTSSK